MDILRINYEAIKKNCDFMESMTDDYTLRYGTGDWCAPFVGPAIGKNMGSYKCPVQVSDTGFFYNAANTIAKLAKMFDNCYVLDFRKYAPDFNGEFKKSFYLAGHMNPMGYRLVALMVESYIDYIIRHNMDDFRQIAFVGTPYHNEKEKW